MDVAGALAFVARHHRGVLATLRADGGVQMSPVLAGVDGEGRMVVSSRETAYKVRNLRRRPEATLCVFTDAFFGEWVQIEGTAQIVPLPGAMEPLVDYYRRVSGEHPDWDDYRAAMRRERRVLIRIDPRRTGPTRRG
jgi:PPOX class probable F420-dependent enzyme